MGKVELLVQDDRPDASEAATIVTKFVTQDQVHAVIGEVASSRSIAAAPIAQNAKIPMLTPSSTNPEVTRKATSHLPQLLHRSLSGGSNRSVRSQDIGCEDRRDHG